MTYHNWKKLAVLVLLGAGIAFGGCASSSKNGTPSNEDAGTNKKKDSGTSTKDSGSATKDASTKDSGPASKDASTKDSGPGSDGGGTGSCAKDSSKACYTCDKPTTDDQFLNHCTSATCTAYDNSKLTKIVNGKLPDLP